MTTEIIGQGLVDLRGRDICEIPVECMAYGFIIRVYLAETEMVRFKILRIKNKGLLFSNLGQDRLFRICPIIRSAVFEPSSTNFVSHH